MDAWITRPNARTKKIPLAVVDAANFKKDIGRNQMNKEWEEQGRASLRRYLAPMSMIDL